MKILVFNKRFFRLSETFIHRQINSLAKFDLSLLAMFPYEHKDRLSLDLPLYLIPASRMFDKILTSFMKKTVGWKYSFTVLQVRYLSQLFLSKGIQVVHVHYGWNGLLFLSFLKKKKMPLVVSFHGNDASGALRKKHYVARLPELFDYASAIIICSAHMHEALKLENWKHKVHLIPYGIDVDQFKSLPLPKKSNQIKILHAGRLVSKKGVPDLIEVVISLKKRHANIELHIIGDGEELDRCKKLAEATDNSGIFIHGAQSNTLVKDFMTQCDIFVLNSRVGDDGDMEGLPNALLEAMSCSRAVISTYHAGIPMAIEHMKEGLLVPEKDNNALKRALEELIGNDLLRATLGRNARMKAESQFSVEIMNNRLETIFDRIINKSATSS